MRDYIVRRVVFAIPTILLVSVLVFLTVHILPGDAALLKLTGSGGQPDKAGLQALRHQMGLDQPIYVQFGSWIWNVIRHGDLGTSYGTGRSVTQEILAGLPVTVELAIGSIILGVSMAIPWGIFASVHQDGPGDYIPRLASVLLLSVPNFWIATLLVVFPAIWFGFMPSPGYTSLLHDPLANLAQFALPCVALGSRLIGTTLRMTRSSMLEVLRQDYVRAAWAKGLRQHTVLYRHALKNAMIPVITLIGGQVAFLLGGSVIIENIFGLPGIGNLTIQAIYQRDYPQIQANVLLIAIVVVFVNLATDLCYGWLDPRISYR